MYEFKEIPDVGNAKEIIYGFKKAPHLSNIIDPAEPTSWQHGWNDSETLLCPLLYRLTVLIIIGTLKTDGCWNYSDAKHVNSAWVIKIENNFLRVN